MKQQVRNFFDGKWAVWHPGWAAGLLGLLAIALGLGLSCGPGWDTDILRLLPGEMAAVEGLAVYQQEFSQSRELAFLLEWDGAAEDGSSVRDLLVRELQGQSWVERVLGGAPFEGGGLGTGERMLLATLALNREAGIPRDAWDPQRIKTRLRSLAQRVAAGSPAATAELLADPLGIFGPAMSEAAKALDLEGVLELESSDARAWIVPVAVKLAELGEAECRRLMDEVRQFVTKFEQRFPPGVVRVGVTGRAAYVTEVAAAMRRDFMLTSMISAVVVLGIFWLGYRTLWPLVGIGVLLSLSAALALAFGFFLLGPLNLVAVSFCSILFGLGDDFSLLICQRHATERARGLSAREAAAHAAAGAAPGIRAVAWTTGLGFLALGWSGSAGFAQLGVMVALGVGVCAVLMPAFFGVFLLRAHPLQGGGGLARLWTAWCCERKGVRRWLPAGLIFSAAFAVAVAGPPLPGFDLSPRSLEPRATPAAQTLEKMMQRFPAMFEPVMVVIPNPSVQSLELLDRTLSLAQERGLILRASSPSPLVPDPQRLARNAPRKEDQHQALVAALEAARSLGLGEKVEEALQGQAEALEQAARWKQGWTSRLPSDSPWWFVLERMLAPEGQAAVAYLQLPENAGPSERRALASLLEQEVPGCLVTGWSQLLAELIPWAHRQLAVFGGGVLVVILLMLGIVYRDVRDWLWHVVAMGAAGLGLLASLQLFRFPINLLNVLAFPLILGVGVDYGTHLLLAARQGVKEVAGTLRAVTFSAMTTIGGFGALMFAKSPALSGLGFLCALGVFWCWVGGVFVLLPRICSANCPRK